VEEIVHVQEIVKHTLVVEPPRHLLVEIFLLLLAEAAEEHGVELAELVEVSTQTVIMEVIVDQVAEALLHLAEDQEVVEAYQEHLEVHIKEELVAAKVATLEAAAAAADLEEAAEAETTEAAEDQAAEDQAF
jgi:hypothetical protein